MAKTIVVSKEDNNLNEFTREELELWQEIERGMQDLLDGKVKIL